MNYSMPICYHCGREVNEIFRCEKCGQNYCSVHKNPIDHECNIVLESQGVNSLTSLSNLSPSYSETQVAYPSINSDVNSIVRGTTDGTYTWYRQEKQIPEDAFSPNSGIDFKGILLAHKSELLHFIIGGSLIFIIGLISFWDPQLFTLGYGWALFMLAGFYMTAFLFHELGHRQVAIHFGLQTKFRLLTFGMLLTVIGLLTGLFSLISNSPALPSLALPGAVVVLGLDKVNRKTGLCKAAGPTINLIYGSALLVISFLIPSMLYPLNYFFALAAYLNYMLGAFNMIPFGILDGQNIFKWNKKVYFILMTGLIVFLIVTIVLVYTPFGTSIFFPL
jgi:Zn-dependent protease